MKHHHSNQQVAPRTGSTLSEVLISVMVLGIGVISVATLFPLSVLQAVRANHTTQGTILRYNAEAAIDALDLKNKFIFFGYDGAPGELNINEDLDASTDFTGWHPGPDGQPGDAGVDDDGDGNIDNITDYSDNEGTDDYQLWDFDELRPGEFNSSGTRKDLDVVMIDPLGFYRRGADTVTLANRDSTPPPARARFFGWIDGNNNRSFDDPSEVQTALHRITGGHRGNNSNFVDAMAPRWNYQFSATEPSNNLSQVENLVTLTDQYSTILDAPAFSSNGVLGSVLLDSKISGRPMADIQNDQLSNGIPVQVILFNINGDSLVRTVTGGNGDKRIDFSPDLPDGNGDGDPDFQIERVVLQQKSFDFTWLITASIRSQDADPVFDVVVFYKRQYSDADEQLFRMTLGEDFDNDGDIDPGEDINQNGQLDVLDNVLNFNFASETRVQAKVGEYLFDAENAEWYRILEINDKTTTSITLTIDRPLRDDNGNGVIFGAFMAGIVDVFPIGRKN